MVLDDGLGGGASGHGQGESDRDMVSISVDENLEWRLVMMKISSKRSGPDILAQVRKGPVPLRPTSQT